MIEITQQEVMKDWGTDNSDAPVVSIECMTYNHEKYVAQTLDSFLMQKTNFPFEVIVHDDASTDKTADIIREYEKRFPKIIKPVFQTQNQYSKHDGTILRIFMQTMKGKYVACCEGDDYWIDELKLQKQYDFMESHKDCSMIFTNAIEHYEDGSVPDKVFSNVKDKKYLAKEFYKKWTIPTASVMCTMEGYLKNNIQDNRIMYGDMKFFLTLSRCGSVYGLSDVTSVYRRQPSGAVYGFSFDRSYRQYYHDTALAEYFPEVKHEAFKLKIKRVVRCCYKALELKDKPTAKKFFKQNPAAVIFLLPPYALVKSLKKGK